CVYRSLRCLVSSSLFCSPAPSTLFPYTTLFRSGHSTRSVEELIGLLRESGIRLLVDVRRYPGSRRHPQFGRDALAAALRAAGIEDRKSTRLNSSHVKISYAVFCLKKKTRTAAPG